MSTPADFLAFTLQVTLVIVAIAIVCAFIRLLRGPSLPDRVVALDLMVNCVIALIAVDAIRNSEAHFLRAGIVLALLAFLGTLAFGYYIHRGQRT